MFYIRELSTLHRRSFARKNSFSSCYIMWLISPSFVRPHNTCVYFYVTHCLRTEIRACINERPRALCNCFNCAEGLDIQKRDTSGWDLQLQGRGDVGVRQLGTTTSFALGEASLPSLPFSQLPHCRRVLRIQMKRYSRTDVVLK